MSIGGDAITRLAAKVPTVQAPFTAPTLSVPFLSCFSGDGRTFVGRHFSNRPDLLKLQHLKQLIVQYEERIITQTIGKLDNPLRSAGFVAQIVEITDKIATATAAITSAVGEITEEIDAGISFINDRITDLNALRAELNAVPENLRTKVAAHLIARYEQYFGELESQLSRLNAARACVQSFL